MGAVFLTFIRLGCTAFGGPIAHLGYFRRAFVEERRWLDERTYAEIVALCSFLPGPTSSQVGMLVGTLRAGIGGAFAAWAGFTLPSAVLMTLVAYGLPPAGGGAWIHGLLLAAVAVVADAIVEMARSLVTDAFRIVLAVAAAALVAMVPTTWGQLAALALGALAGLAFLRRDEKEPVAPIAIPVSRRAGTLVLVAFALSLIALSLLARYGGTAALLAGFFRAGSLVFGGGHVVLPLLQTAFVPQWIDDGPFLAGYGAAQAMPGPLFTFAAFLGASVALGPAGWAGALLAICAIFAPSFFLIFGIAPFWRDLRGDARVAAAIRGLGCVVVGLLLAAFIHPIWSSAVGGWIDVAIVTLVFVLLRLRRIPPWGAVALAAILGGLAGRWQAGAIV